MKTAFITEITGQNGSYLAEFLLGKGYQISIGMKWEKFKRIMQLCTLLFVIFLCSSCEKDKFSDAENNENDDSYELYGDSPFLLKDINGNKYTPFYVTDTICHFVIPQNVSLDNMSIITQGGKIINKSETYDLSDFTSPLTIQLLTQEKKEKSYKINLYNLPVFIFSTPDSLPIESKVVRTEGCKVKVIDTDGIETDLGTAGIRGRGNSTWQKPKKPYNIKFDKKESILGMNPSKHWVLLSNPYYDRTQLHNDVALQIARLTDYPWIPQGKFVELIMNGEHKGLYYVCEKIRLEKGKIEITEIQPSDTVGDAVTGGYILESSISKEDENSFLTDYYNFTISAAGDWPIYWSFDEPEGEIPLSQKNYIQNALNNLELSLSKDDELLAGNYRKFLDIESFIDWYLVENLCLNEEASRIKNLTLYKDRDSSVSGGRFTIGPPWDFDAWTFGLKGKKKLYVNDTWYFQRLLKDPLFVQRLKEKWKEYIEKWKYSIPSYIDEQYTLIRNSALRNEVMWNDWSYVNRYPQISYDQLVKEMKETFIEQLEWMNNIIEKM